MEPESVAPSGRPHSPGTPASVGGFLFSLIWLACGCMVRRSLLVCSLLEAGNLNCHPHTTAPSRVRPSGPVLCFNPGRSPDTRMGRFLPHPGLVFVLMSLIFFLHEEWTMSDDTSSDRAYNAITRGFGYLNRIREIRPPAGPSYLACDVALLHGLADRVEKIRFSCVIRGSSAVAIVRQHFTAADGTVASPERPVMASLSLGGLRAETFVYRKGEKKGQTGIALRSTLLAIEWLRIGRQVIDLNAGRSASEPAERPAPVPKEPAFVAEMRAEVRQSGTVQLAKDHPEFEERRAFLRDHGFTWSRSQAAWVRKSPPEAGPTPEPEAPF